EGLGREGRVERLDPQRLDGAYLLGPAHHVDGEPLARPGLGEVEARPVVEPHAQREHRGLAAAAPAEARAHRRRRGFLRPAQPPGPGEVEHEVELGVGLRGRRAARRLREHQVEPLAVPSRPRDDPADERRHRRVERLERGDLRDVRGDDRAAGRAVVEEPDEGLDLGQLGHGDILPAGRVGRMSSVTSGATAAGSTRVRGADLLRLSTLFVRTLREDPADAEVASHKLLVRAGYIRRAAPGIYTWLPLGLRVLRKVEAVVREEMAAAGAQEVHFPALLPKEPYEATGRWTEYGPNIFRL